MVTSMGFENPERISRVMVVGTHSLLPPLPEGEDSGDGDGGEAARELTLDSVRAAMEALLVNRSIITPELVRTVFDTRRWMSARPRAAARDNRVQADRSAERQKGVPLWRRLDQIPVPLLMMYGINDRPTTARRLGLLRDLYPSLDLRVLQRCGHVVQWDAADEFIAAAGGFFNGLQ